jgi:hypothetical protein
MTALLDIAVAYAERGWPVFPLKAGEKIPATPHGFKDAISGIERVRRWWERHPDSNIGIATGHAFDVLDLDGPGAEAALDAAMPNGGDPVVGPTVETPRGYHCYVSHTGHGNAIRVGGLPGVDWRGIGGYVVAPGSRKPDGTEWSWEFPDDPLYGPDADIRPAPRWLLDLLIKRPEPGVSAHETRPFTGEPNRYARAALERASGRLAFAPVGARNDTLNREAHGMGRLAGAGLITASEAGKALLSVALRLGLSEHEAVATIRSGLIAGMANPRKVPA